MAVKHQLLHHLFVLRAVRCYHSDFILCMAWHEQLQEANDWNIPLQPHLCSSPEKPGKCPKRTKETDTASCPCHSASCQMPFDCQPHYPLSPLAIKAFGILQTNKADMDSQTWFPFVKAVRACSWQLGSCWCLVSACCKEPFPQCTQAVGLQLKNGTLLHTWPLPSSLQPPSCHRCSLMEVQAGTSPDTASFPCKAHWWWYKARKRREHTNIWHKSKDKMCWMHIVDK